MSITLEVDLGDGKKLHAIRTPQGMMFSMVEIAIVVFGEKPPTFVKELRQGRYPKQLIQDKPILEALLWAGIPPESTIYPGVTLLSLSTVQDILNDKRKFELVPVLKVALMRMVTQEASMLMAKKDYEEALVLALDAIRQGQTIFFPAAPMQLVPLYLLAAQVCLSLGRSPQCEELMGIAAWLFLQSPKSSDNYETQAEISRLFEKLDNALQAFAEEIYYSSVKHGLLDTRTSIGFYNIFKVLKSQGRYEDSLASGEVVTDIWFLSMIGLVLKIENVPTKTFGDMNPEIILDMKILEESIQWIHIEDVVLMLRDIATTRESLLGVNDANCGDIYLTIGLLYLYKKEMDLTFESLLAANRSGCSEDVRMMVDNAFALLDEHRLVPTDYY